jgi:radical SAM superfamily enzyme YgiQ (UPF0313 family)
VHAALLSERIVRDQRSPLWQSRSGAWVTLVRPLINESTSSPFFLPLGVLCVGSYLRRRGFQVDIVDFEFLYRRKYKPFDTTALVEPERRLLEAMLARIIERAPLVVGLSALADSLPICIRLGEELKKICPDVVVVIGGPGVFGVEDLLCARFGHAFDFLCPGEGEIAMATLCESLLTGFTPVIIPGFVASNAGGTVQRAPTKYVEPDEFGIIDYDLLPVNEYLDISSPRLFDYYLGSGCTFSCSFCTTAPFWGKRFRAKSPARVLAELRELKERFGVTVVNFLHDNFANSRAYFDEFMNYFIANNDGFAWGCAIRSDALSVVDLTRMRQAGCQMVFCGADAGSERILRDMRKMSSSRKTYAFYENCRTAGIALETNTILGYPNEGPEELELSLDVIFDTIAFGGRTADVSILQPLPGAAVTNTHRSCLEYFGKSAASGFYPIWLEQFVKKNLDIFSGYGFLRRGNQAPFYYVQLTEFVRFFTRHFFLTLYALKHVAGIAYVEFFENVFRNRSIESNWEELLLRYSAALSVPASTNEVIRDVVRWDAATERVRGTKYQDEFDNPYASPSCGTSENWVLLDTRHPIHDLRRHLPESIRKPLREQAITYLIFVAPEGMIATAILTAEQRNAWNSFSSSLRSNPVAAIDEESTLQNGSLARLFTTLQKCPSRTAPDFLRA